jgi:hypothetical protein
LAQQTKQAIHKRQNVPTALFAQVDDTHPSLGKLGLVDTSSKKYGHHNRVPPTRQTFGQRDQLAFRAATIKRTRQEQNGFSAWMHG